MNRLTHVKYCRCLISKCSIHPPKFLQVFGANLRHTFGNCPLKREYATLSNMLSIPISPARAFCKFSNVFLMVAISLLNLSSSCRRTTTVGDIILWKYRLTFHISYSSGIFFSMSFATFSMNSSLLIPSPTAAVENMKFY